MKNSAFEVSTAARTLGRIRQVAVALLIGALAGCANSPPTVFYTLEPLPSTAARPAASTAPVTAAPLRVDAVRLPGVLNRPEIFQRKGPNVLQVDDFARWAAPLGEMMQRVLTQDLMDRMPAGSVAYPDAPQPAAVALTVEVLAFDVGDGRASLSVAWYMGPRSRSLRLEVPVQGGSPSDSAKALSALLALLADDIASPSRA
jgi:uncharacterized protein